MHETIDAHPTVNDSTGIQETPRKSRFLRRNWKKAALALIGLDLLYDELSDSALAGGFLDEIEEESQPSVVDS